MLSSSIVKLFARSPLNPLQEHMQKVYECAEKLLLFFEAVLAEDWGKAAKYQIQIAKLENEADDIKRDIRLHLPKSLFLPVSRTDILELLISQDSIANKAKDIAGLILGRQMHFPKEIAKQIAALLERSVAAASQANSATAELSELFESGFRGSEIKIVKEMIKKLDHIENETDEIKKEVRYSLFKIENDLPPVEVMFLYKIIDWLGDLANRAQHVGGKLHLLLAR